MYKMDTRILKGMNLKWNLPLLFFCQNVFPLENYSGLYCSVPQSVFVIVLVILIFIHSHSLLFRFAPVSLFLVLFLPFPSTFYLPPFIYPGRQCKLDSSVSHSAVNSHSNVGAGEDPDLVQPTHSTSAKAKASPAYASV